MTKREFAGRVAAVLVAMFTAVYCILIAFGMLTELLRWRP